ncbi:MAG: hypothetical protein HW383_601 [Candidatus Magasanikbacteria bacterium]|nr:hypothetical protein [Candidatus Magasanikbacteria bacterium]
MSLTSKFVGWYERRYGIERRALLTLDIVLISAAVAALGIFIASKFYVVPSHDVSFEVKTSELIFADSAKIEMQIKNGTVNPLDEVTVAVASPKGFIIENAEPDWDAQKNTFSVGTLAPGAKIEFTLIGALYVSVNDTDRLTATLAYKDQVSGERKKQELIVPLTPRRSALEANANLPEGIILGSQTPFTVTVRNKGARKISDAAVLVSVDGVEIVGGEPAIDSFGNWTDLTFEAKETKTFTAVLDSRRSQSGETKLILTPSVKIPDGGSALAAAVESRIKIVKAGLTLQPVFSDTNLAVTTAPTGEIVIKNNGAAAVDDVSLEVNLTPNDLAQTEKNKITPNDFPALQKINSGAEFRVPIKFTLNALTLSGPDIFDPSIALSISLTGAIDGQKIQITSAPVWFKVNGELNAAANAAYFSPQGEQLGRGPLPPKVGEQTTYWVTVDVGATTSNIENVVWEATLPAGVIVTGKSNVLFGEPLVYGKGKITWKIPKLPAHSRGTISFEVGLTPKTADRGKIPTLLRDIHVAANDSFTGATLTKNLPDIDVGLPSDTKAQEKGVYVK